ncbi:caspase recruitment domain-containing protein 19-like isoform X2 [Acipenser ruthenus]|uniref:caspase recruitment domain-containing protein 19-like isoform X2 n=1 Tax=Acipenser ruthenus TaxID=7906 RepID=UPI0027415F39|nr:caspase recruitment domain-containing protein 19-like isoform X2 [Acipenser ruthenus]
MGVMKPDSAALGGKSCHHGRDEEVRKWRSETDTYCDQLEQDSWFLKNDYRLSAQLVEKLVLQLNRIHPNVLSDKEAQKFRDVKVPTKTRLADLLSTLKEKGEEACHEFYRALHIHAEQLYISLPSRKRQRGPMFFIICFSVVAGLALYYYSNEEDKVIGDAKKILGFTAIGLSRRAKAMLISYAEDQSKNQ